MVTDPSSGLSQVVRRDAGTASVVLTLTASRGRVVGSIALEGQTADDAAWERFGGPVGTETLPQNEAFVLTFDSACNRRDESLGYWVHDPGVAWRYRNLRTRFQRFSGSGDVAIELDC